MTDIQLFLFKRKNFDNDIIQVYRIRVEVRVRVKNWVIKFFTRLIGGNQGKHPKETSKGQCPTAK